MVSWLCGFSPNLSISISFTQTHSVSLCLHADSFSLVTSHSEKSHSYLLILIKIHATLCRFVQLHPIVVDDIMSKNRRE